MRFSPVPTTVRFSSLERRVRRALRDFEDSSRKAREIFQWRGFPLHGDFSATDSKLRTASVG